MNKPLEERFKSKYQILPNGCWQWIGAIGRWGYGNIGADDHKKTLRAHRVSYMLYKGAIPEGLVLDHLCRNRACVNPDHLEPVTQRVNNMRTKARITHCPKGHEYSPKNTYIEHHKNGDVSRHCRTCHLEQVKNAARAKRARVA